MGDGTFVQLESFRSYPPKFGETKIFASDLVPGNVVLSEYLTILSVIIRVDF